MPTVNWGSSSLTYSGSQRVYLRQRWSDAWTLNSDLWCNEASWSLLPAMPTASLEYLYGRILPFGSNTWTNRSKLDIGGWYVKIEIDCEDGTVTWVGFIDEVADIQGGRSTVASGVQSFVAYAMPQVLASEIITESRWYDQRNSVARQSGSAIAFNAGGNPNRTPSVKAGEDTHLYMARDRRLNTAPDKPDFWTSRDIVQYLFEHAMPKDQDGNEKIKWRLDGLTLIPNWDKPTIDTEGQSVLAILTSIVNASRLLQLSTSIDESTTPDTVVFTVHSLSSTSLTLPNSETFPANSNPLAIITTDAIDTNVVTQRSETQTVHQIVIKGGMRESCGTWQISTTASDLLCNGFSSSDETTYETAASATTGYSGLSDSDKRRRNERQRAKPGLRDVYRTFDLLSSWTFAVDTGGYVFETDDASPARYYPYWGEIKILPQLPLKQSVDYSGSEVATGAAFEVAKDVQDYRPPYVLFKKPSSSPAVYIQAEKMANRSASPLFSVQVGVENDGQSLTLDVNGAEQHAIAEGQFTALAVDYTTAQYGSWDYRDALITMSLQEDRFAEARYPEDADLPTRDAIRRKVIYAGPAYKLVRVLDETIVELNNDGTTVDSSGGTLVDDRDKLQSLAMIAASWWLVPRQVLRLVSARPSATPAVGQLLTTVNAGTSHAATVNTVVSQISVQSQRGEDGAPSSATYTLITAMGELDPLSFSPPPPVIQPGQVTA